jgi:hypothetical protein
MNFSKKDIRRKVLLVSAYADYPMRATSREHLYAFRQYANDDIYYLNLVVKKVPKYVLKVDFDLIIFHTFFLTNHWRGREHFSKLIKRAEPLKKTQGVKAMLAQDEFINSDLLSEFINDFKIDFVFSVAPPTTWKNIYRTVDFERVRFFNVLTGYLDETKLPKIIASKESINNRHIDIGYRAMGRPAYWMGSHGFLKQEIADVFQKEAGSFGLNTDISTSQDDAILGDDWYVFLSRCKYTIGVESGTSMVDQDGSIRECTERYLVSHPDAGMKEVEAVCFPGLDGTTLLFALAPRHLECCATRTCQVLIEGDYNGILKPGVHYIELKKDFSNMRDVLKDIADDSKRSSLVNRAYDDIVASGKYTYRSFVTFVLDSCIPSSGHYCRSGWKGQVRSKFILTLMDFVEKWEQFCIILLSPLRGFIRKAVSR